MEISKFWVVSTIMLSLKLILIIKEGIIYPSPAFAQETLSASKFYFEADRIQERQILEISGLTNSSRTMVLKVGGTTSRDLYSWSEKGGQRHCSVSVYNQAGERQAYWDIASCSLSRYVGPTLTTGLCPTSQTAPLPYETLEIRHERIQRLQ